ncbi:MAG: ribbon-helix-helix protein, CopG family [Planctomycetota bacterium]
MSRNSTLHVKLDDATDEQLYRLAEKRDVSKSELVREAIAACYQTSFKELPLRQQRALSAYEGGFISIGRLAEVMGMHVLELRNWLHEHDVPMNSRFDEQDVTNA